MPFTFESTDIPDVLIIAPKVFADARGFFMETYKRSEFEAAGLPVPRAGEPLALERRARCAACTISASRRRRESWCAWSSARSSTSPSTSGQGSPTFGRWVGVTLSADNRKSIYVPPGFAHGFCVISPEAEVIYKTTEEYAPEHEHGIRWDDPALASRGRCASRRCRRGTNTGRRFRAETAAPGARPREIPCSGASGPPSRLAPETRPNLCC